MRTSKINVRTWISGALWRLSSTFEGLSKTFEAFKRFNGLKGLNVGATLLKDVWGVFKRFKRWSSTSEGMRGRTIGAFKRFKRPNGFIRGSNTSAGMRGRKFGAFKRGSSTSQGMRSGRLGRLNG